ncbi:ABC transporter ATP-binding protein [Skermania piniformis]|uniref:ABC transporter ATP-binding protein n=1 Tax=Skermania pinensis TaxID=39122 RepID=A0ABX8S8U0_9ACTN|nr:ABC transporter ATP-binding protein [Skermania piniformis]QXQ13701.1 ABC transporter ATP-binding protein [Skermania piniformis]
MSEIVVTDLAKSFAGQPVLRGVDLQLAGGRRTAVIGASGSGKTTLLRLIAGFETPDAGSVTIDGETVSSNRTFVPPHRRQIGYVAQDGALFPHLSVEQNIAYGLPAAQRRRRAGADRVRALLDMVALPADFARRRPHELSGGQQQRVALARALARQPVLMLLDEPFSALDAGLRAATRAAVATTLAEAGVTTLLVTHDQEEALSFADRIAVMRAGRFTQVGTPQQVYAQPVDRFTAAFLGDCVLLPATIDGGVADCLLGRIPVAGNASGAATVMLRPEQLVTRAAHPDGTAVAHPDGTVVATEFLGAEMKLTVDLAGTPVAVRQASVIGTALHSRVRIDVQGSAIAFPADLAGNGHPPP